MKTALVLEQREDSPPPWLTESFPLGKESLSASFFPSRKDIVKAFRQALHPARDAPYISAVEWRLTPDFDIKIRIHCPAKRIASIFEQTSLNRRIQAGLESLGLKCSFEYTTDIQKRHLARKAAWKELWPKALLGTHSPEEIRDWVGKNIPKGCIHYSVDFADVYTENCEERDLENIVILHTSLPENRRSEFQDFMTKFEQKFKCPIIPVLTEVPFDPFSFLQQHLGLDSSDLIRVEHIPNLVKILKDELANYTLPEPKKFANLTNLDAFSCDGTNVQKRADIFAFERIEGRLFLHVAIPDDVRRLKPWKRSMKKQESLQMSVKVPSFSPGKVQSALLLSWELTEQGLIPVGTLTRCRIKNNYAASYDDSFLESHVEYQKLKKVLSRPGKSLNDSAVVEYLMRSFYKRAGLELKANGVPFLSREHYRLDKREISSLIEGYNLDASQYEITEEAKRNVLLIDLLLRARDRGDFTVIPRILNDLIGRGCSSSDSPYCPLKAERGALERANQVSVAAHLDGLELPRDFTDSLYGDALTPLQIQRTLNIFEAKFHLCRLIAVLIDELKDHSRPLQGKIVHESPRGHLLVEVSSMKRWVRIDNLPQMTYQNGDTVLVRIKGFSVKHRQFIATLA